MTKPIGYFCSGTMPGDTGLLADMQESWGSTFEAINNAQRLWMIQQISSTLSQNYLESNLDSPRDSEVKEVAERLDELSPGQLLGLLDALVAQVKGN
ncbi:hypothetical protein [Nostoc sp. NMS4]|uniref:hypothetical protein n=1 Tax=Nostoc sp. NMS4 TaxID=2815390 RepID=UPI0025D94CCE|nr:hypothetical protein [Nostoc sp. NMS4]MBN3925636.1 hypothetical protein [Nostoc sp. NMS4]